MKNHPHPARHSRGAFSLIEFVVAAGLLAAVGLIIMPLLASLLRTRTELASQDTAQRELRNLAELALSGEDVQGLVISDSTLAVLDEPQLDVTVVSSAPENKPLEQVVLSLSWVSGRGERVPAIQLAFWRPLEEEVE